MGVFNESAAFFFMGMSGWWSVNALLWAESPIYVNENYAHAHEGSPEGPAISNWLNIACQVGNIFPFAYKAVLSSKRQAANLNATILASNAVAVATCIVCAMYWEGARPRARPPARPRLRRRRPAAAAAPPPPR